VRYASASARRAAALKGITCPVAIALYDEGMEALKARDADTYMAALQLRDACVWTEVIEEIGKKLRRAMASGEESEAQVRTLMRGKAAAEAARTKILDSLLLTPQRPRGRPRGEDAGEKAAGAGMDAWDAFDAEDGEDA